MKQLQVEVFSTFDGTSQLVVPAAAAPATSRLTGAGECAFVFKLSHLARFGVDKTKARALFATRSRMIAMHDGEQTVPYAGIIIRRGVVDDAAGTLTVKTSESRIATSWRQTVGVNNVTGGDLIATGKSASGAFRAILQRMTQWGPAWQLPIDWEDLPDTAGIYDIDARWWDTLKIEDLWQSLEDRGLELYFQPYRRLGGSLRLRPIIAPTIAIGVTDFTVKATRSKISNLAVDEDSVNTITGVIAAGNGSGSDTLFAWAGNSGSTGIPIADVRRDFADIHDPVALQQAANAELAAYEHDIEQWSLEIALADSGLDWSHVAIGRQLRLDVRRHLWIPDGVYTKRIIAASPTLGANVLKVEVQ
jgi:hypothetical protein